MIKTANKIIATFFYSGYFPVAPGTFGSLVALIVWLLFPTIIGLKTGILVLTLFLGFYATSNVTRGLEVRDPGFIVIDEVVGMWITLLLIDIFFEPNLKWPIIGFFLFRAFDIIKPYPISASENLGGSLGIMLDDILAGLFSAIVLILIKTL